MLVKPVFNGRVALGYPIDAFVFVSPKVRKFCCFVGVEYSRNKKINCGAGVLTTLGILTAFHLIDKKKPDLIYASFIRSDYDYFSFELGEPLVFPELDLAIFESPSILPDFYEPASVIVDQPDLIREVLKKEKIYGFGCPDGMLGVVWRVKSLVFCRGKIHSKGFAFFGVSGGPIFYFKDGKPVVLAINIAFYPGSGTLISQTFEFKLKEGRRWRKM